MAFAASLADELGLEPLGLEPPISPGGSMAELGPSLADEFGFGGCWMCALTAGDVLEEEKLELEEMDGLDPLDELDPLDSLDPHAELDLEQLEVLDSPHSTPRKIRPPLGVSTPRRAASRQVSRVEEPETVELHLDSLQEAVAASAGLVTRLKGLSGVHVEERLAAFVTRVGEAERAREEQLRVLAGLGRELDALGGEWENTDGDTRLDALLEDAEAGPLSEGTALLAAATLSLGTTLTSLADTTAVAAQTAQGLTRTARGIRIAVADARRREVEEAACRRAVELFEADIEGGRRVDAGREMRHVLDGFRGVLADAECRLAALAR